MRISDWSSYVCSSDSQIARCDRTRGEDAVLPATPRCNGPEQEGNDRTVDGGRADVDVRRDHVLDVRSDQPIAQLGPFRIELEDGNATSLGLPSRQIVRETGRGWVVQEG